jgi:hypothetical protein
MAVSEAKIDDLEAKQEWWWVAEKKRSKRLDYLFTHEVRPETCRALQGIE